MLLCVAALATSIGIAGCKEAEEIRQYTVKLAPLPEPTHRMLVAIVPAPPSVENDPENSADAKGDPATAKPATSEQGAQAWFFKLVAPIEQADRAAPAFDQFIGSIRTRNEGLPEWNLPQGWAEDPDARAPEFGREATIRIAESELELTVSKLPMPGERNDRWLQGNVNRWRDQMNLPPIALGELAKHIQKLGDGDKAATKVDLRGVFSGSSMAGRFAAGKRMHDKSAVASSAPATSPDIPNPHKSAPSSSSKVPFDSEVPESWKAGRAGGIRAAAYAIVDDDGRQVAEITVTPLGPGAGDLKANVDRWRQEIKLSTSTPEELENETRRLEIDGQKADYVHLVGPKNAQPREATLGVILRRPDRIWFFKLRGPVEVVAKEKERFEAFVKSVKFN
jgi:hypothetical protein